MEQQIKNTSYPSIPEEIHLVRQKGGVILASEIKGKRTYDSGDDDKKGENKNDTSQKNIVKLKKGEA